MIIKLPEWDNWRIEGKNLDWQIQEYSNDKKAEGGKRWRGVNFWPSVEYAIAHAYERTLKECGRDFTDLESFVNECKRVKRELIAEVKKATSEQGGGQ